MAKTDKPLFGFNVRGTLGKALTFRRSGPTTIAEKKPIPTNTKSLAQLSWRTMYQKATALWHALSPAEQQDWESQATRKHMTGYAWFMSQCLKPNPGLYLPLQGGTMKGDIDMASSKVLNLPVPTADEEPTRKQELSDHAALTTGAHGFDKSARVYNDAQIPIPDAAWTAVPFNSELWDTDNIHDNVTNNSRLTCKTAGKYQVVGQVCFLANATGIRNSRILANGTTVFAVNTCPKRSDNFWYAIVVTIVDLDVDDYVELQVYQNSGDDLNLATQNYSYPEFMMARIA